jgi:glutathione synthase/RimK-type ligase-like ATP-grasp enzyme
MKWINVQKNKENQRGHHENILYVSKELENQLKNKTKLVFGQREIAITVKAISSISEQLENSFQNPLSVQLSSCLFDNLLIKESSIYQMYDRENVIYIGPVIGFLLGEQHYYYHHRRLQEITDAMGAYEKVGGLFIAFSHCSISWEEDCLYGLYFNYQLKKWQYDKLPLPSVVYRRGFNERNNFINEAFDHVNWKVFNAVKVDKWKLYNELKKHRVFETYLPETALLTAENVGLFLKKYSKVILKPNKLSRGRGITVLKAVDNDDIEVHDHRKFTDFKLSHLKLVDYLQEGNFFGREYIIQPFLDLARINGSPWDIRVVMQKNPKKKWICNGIECRLAGTGKLLTNICRGGTALHLDEALKQAFPAKKIDIVKINKEIKRIAKEFCEVMDQSGIHFAEFGLDIALDQQLQYWFIEANVRPTFKGFKNLDEQIYQKICYEPILYSASIAGFSWEGNE